MTDPIRMSAPDLDESDEAAVLGVLRSGVLSLGSFAEEFERLAAERAGTRHAVAVSSGTAGLHMIVKALGIEAGSEVLVPSFTFAASLNAFLYEGATPVFVDIESNTYNLDPEELSARRSPRTTAAMVVDVFGHPADWAAIELAASDLMLIDDCCEAIGASYADRPVGSFGVAGCFAFYPNKQITTGEGGMVVTDDAGLARMIRSLRNQGRGDTGPWLKHERVGFNYRMDELSAALGVSQIKRLAMFLARRESVANMYSERLAGFDWVRTPRVGRKVKMSWFVYVVTLARDVNRDAVIEAMASEGIPTRAYFPPLHLQPYVRERYGTRAGMLPVTEDVARRTLALPFHNHITEPHVERVVRALKRAV
jgi:dTDP-4-amino-4,6-dideoxygalactose transaminase